MAKGKPAKGTPRARVSKRVKKPAKTAPPKKRPAPKKLPVKKAAVKKAAVKKAPVKKPAAKARVKKTEWQRKSKRDRFSARSERAKKGWQTRHNKAAQAERLKGLAGRKRRGTLTEYDERVIKVDAIRARLARGGRITGQEFSDTFGYIKRDGSIAVTWSKLRVLDDAEKILARMEAIPRGSPDWHDEAGEIAEEYDVEVREVYSLVMSP